MGASRELSEFASVVSVSSGNVGIGTSSPSYKFHVSGTSVGGFVTSYVTNTDTTSGSGAASYVVNGTVTGVTYASQSVGGLVSGTVGSVPYLFITNNNERMRIDSSGNVGIGTSSPSYKFHTSASDGIIALINGTTRGVRFVTNSSQSSIQGVDNTGGASYQPLFVTGSLLQFGIAGSENARFDASGNFLMTTAAGLGYGTGSGGTVTQATSKSTAVTLNKPTGQITMNAAALAAGASVSFAVNNSIISNIDTIIVGIGGGQSAWGNYRIEVIGIGAGSFGIRITNTTAGSLSEGVVINFAIIKGATS